jgi:hypothetical protein
MCRDSDAARLVIDPRVACLNPGRGARLGLSFLAACRRGSAVGGRAHEFNRVFLDRFAAFDREAGRPRGVQGLMAGLHTGPIESE